MNFKKIIIVFIFLCGCGVKSDPLPPENSVLPSFPDEFLQNEIKKKKK